jgi:hypothetical protein
MNYIKNLIKFNIVNKEGMTVPFTVNKEQERFINDMTGKDIILKSRQIGFSSVILGMFTLDFLTVPNSRSVCISHETKAAQRLLDRVKYFIKSAEEKGLLVNLKYNSRNELVNSDKNSTFYIAVASDTANRGDTINNLHLSELAFYENPEAIFSSAVQAVTPTGKVFIESTANGMNFLKTFWDKSKAEQTGFKTHFFDNSFYSPEFLQQKKNELGDKFPQEYPSTDTEAWLSSGNCFFDKTALQDYLGRVVEPLKTLKSYYDLLIS